MPLSDASWNEILTALSHKANDAGVRPEDFVGRLNQLKENWDFFKDNAQVKAYIAAKEEAHVRAQRDVVAAQLASIDALIAEYDA